MLYVCSFPEGRAAAHKEEGNYHFRLKEYPQAVEEYSAGLKEGGGDRSLLAILFTNRAAAHFHLGNIVLCPDFLLLFFFVDQVIFARVLMMWWRHRK